MEQKTEASQAVDERQTMMEALSMCIDALDGDTLRHVRMSAQANAVRVLGRAALKAQPAPTEAQTQPTMMTDNEALTWAWKNLREDLGAADWAVGDSCTYFGFFCWGWRYRTQYEKQKTTEAEQRESPFKFRPWSKEAEMVESWTAAEKALEATQGAQLSGNSGELAQGEDSARLDAEVKRLRSVIDTALEGWNMSFELRKMLETALWPASAETGGVKP